MKHKIASCVISVLMIPLLASCTTALADAPAAATTIELDMTSSYDTSDPFINAKLFYVSEDTELVNFETSFQAECESALLEIADNVTKEVFWSREYNDSADDVFTISLRGLDHEKEYVVQLTCTGVEDVTLVMTPDSSLVKERAKPLQSSQASL